jgi:LAO/AO transport system kinase
MIHEYIAFVKENGYFERRRNEQAKYWMYETIDEQLKNNFYRNPVIEELMPRLEKDVLSAQKTSFAAAKEALDIYYGMQQK